MQIRAEKVIRPISWLVPFGLYPIYSEAMGRNRPYATWTIAVVTILASTLFWAFEWSGSPKMQSLKNLMLWTGEGKPNPLIIGFYYATTSYGDQDAFLAKRRQLRGKVPDRELDWAAHEALTPRQQCFGQYHWSQLISHIFLHGGLLHLAGNLVFLFIFCSRVNAAAGNIATFILYPVLGVAAALVHKEMSVSGVPTPMVGASGAIMGMVGAYLLMFPAQKIHMVIWLRWGLIRFFRLSRKFFATRGIVVVLFYIAFDVLYTAIGIKSNVAHWAHLGGFVAGAAAITILMMTRLVHTGGNLLSLTMGKYAWPLIGSPSCHTNRNSRLSIFPSRRQHSPE